MNIDLLSKMVRELLLDNDVVTLPGLGSFVAEMVPAVFSDKGFTINPPYRKLYFRENLDQGNELLANFYARSNDVSEEVATEVLTQFTGEVKEILNSRKNVVFPGLGRLRATKENNYFFVPFDNMDIFPEGVGLEPISLKVHRTPVTQSASAYWGIGDMVEPVEPAEVATDEAEPVGPAEVATDGAEEVVEPAESAESTDEKVEVKQENTEESIMENEVLEVTEHAGEAANETVVEPVEVVVEVNEEEETCGGCPFSGGFRAVIYGIVLLLCVAVILLILFVILAHVAPNFTDHLLYTKEELEIINYPLVK